jgi:pimeloyl-ACP methyl ester carboxylesterase
MNFLFSKKRIMVIFLLTISIFLASGHQKKHIVLVHGAWHGSWVWSTMISLFEINSDYIIHTFDLPAHGIDMTDPANVTLQDYVDKVLSIIDSIQEPVILVGHSMGGIVISMAAEERPKKIAKLVYLAAFIVEDGKSIFDYVISDTHSVVAQNLVIDEAKNIIDVKRDLLKEMFYNESCNFYLHLSQSLFRPTPLLPLLTPLNLTEENYGQVYKVYIKTLEDHAITPYLQNIMLLVNPVNEVYALHSDHSPFLSNPIELYYILKKIAH